jgi:hypothetical protein
VTELGWQKICHFLNGHGKIGVADKAVFAPCLQHPAPHGPTLPAWFARKQPHVWMVFGKILYNTDSIIGAAIFHDYNF